MRAKLITLAITFLLSGIAQAETKPYSSIACKNYADCTFTKVALSPSSQFAIYLVKLPELSNDPNTHGELVDLKSGYAIGQVGRKPACDSIGYGGCDEGIKVFSASFLEVKGVTLAAFDIGFGIPNQFLSIDLCGVGHSAGYLQDGGFDLPHGVDIQYTSFSSIDKRGDELTFSSRNSPREVYSIKFNSHVQEVVGVLNLPLDIPGSLSEGLRVTTQDGMVHYVVPDSGMAIELYLLPNNTLSRSINSLCNVK